MLNTKSSTRLPGNLILLLMMVVTILPLLSMLFTALQPQGSLPAGLSFPREAHWENFATAFETSNFLALAQSSTFIVIATVPAAVLIATLAGYGLAHLQIPGERFFTVLFLLGLTLPMEAIITPLFYQLKGMGLVGSQWSIILPQMALLMPFGVFWMRANFLNASKELSESAQLDGANVWQVFRRIHLPLAIPAWASLSVLYFIWTWNQFLLAIVMVNDPTKRTMAGALGAFKAERSTDFVLLCAGSLLIMLPSLLIFLIFQRHFIKALMQGAVK
ncbi:carbohydrate ABC transporter permease [Arthrobacter sp. BE255]|uniref:carbohydrate ABC transporter permease n=1 Tax=Arthrobacter sp. BE255 TaxID=2817721 RepID=UPI00285B6A1A|nr:carbohydrate ABC transporter permease [Arthrobacter sp. BE255]MDR7159164.1 raffinose/stachyose/melibiose transport system permease protein [Arthrobacter sp. BE255]